MSDETKIEPALTPQQWKDEETIAGNIIRDGFTRDDLSRNGWQLTPTSRVELEIGDATLPQDELPGLIALANAALPDDDPRKITERWVSAMRDAVETMMRDGHGKSLALAEAADALASYLPPETPTTTLRVERGGLGDMDPDLERKLRDSL